MKLRGIEFGPVMGASGVQGFFGEGYPSHRLLRRLFGRRFDFRGMTFVAKTTTLNPRVGNMPLSTDDGITPLEFKPRCVHLGLRGFRKGVALNAVGLSGPGACALFERRHWQARYDRFLISFMSVEKEPAARLKELKIFVRMFQENLPDFHGKVGLQINLSCPNVGLQTEELSGEAKEALDIAGPLGIPLVPKINLLVSPHVAAGIAAHPDCDALCVTNTLPWGALPNRIAWKALFGTNESPLKKFGGGGLSGAPLLPLLIEWLRRADGHISKPVIAGGGILSKDDVWKVSLLRPACISVGSVAMLRPWRVHEVIRAAHQFIR
jgi:dihydroorotate dehydrogenase